MKKVGIALCVLVAGLMQVSAQVSVEIVQDQEQFLPGEAVPLAVRITNRSGQTLRLGAEADWLTFSVEARDGEVLPKVGEVPVQGEFTLESSKVAIKRVDLAPYFQLTMPGRYDVIATMKIRSWNYEFSSRAKPFDIVEGAKLWESEFGVPTTGSDTNATPEIRKFILQQVNHNRGQLRLYLRLTDATGQRVFRVVPIGMTLSFSRPEAQLDQLSQMHLLYQNGPRAYGYTVFNADGELILRQTFDYLGTRPRLRADADGKISVVGGARRVSTTDIPPPKLDSDPPAPKPPVPLKPDEVKPSQP